MTTPINFGGERLGMIKQFYFFFLQKSLDHLLKIREIYVRGPYSSIPRMSVQWLVNGQR